MSDMWFHSPRPFRDRDCIGNLKAWQAILTSTQHTVTVTYGPIQLNLRYLYLYLVANQP